MRARAARFVKKYNSVGCSVSSCEVTWVAHMVTPIIFPFLDVQWVDMHNGERVCKTYGDAYEKKRNCHTGNAFILKNSNTTNRPPPTPPSSRRPPTTSPSSRQPPILPYTAPDGPPQLPVPPSYPNQIPISTPPSSIGASSWRS